MTRKIALIGTFIAALCGLAPVTSFAAVQAPAKVDNSPVPSAVKLKQILTSARKPFVAFGTVLDLDTGKVVFDHNGQRGLTPASVSKLFATAAAARAVHLSDRLVTRVVADGVTKGRAKKLYLIGGGDPSLSKRDLGKLADKVVSAKVTRVRQLVIDSTLFDNKLPRGFREKTTDASYRAPIDALNVDRGTIVISVERGPKVGAKPVVVISPPSAAIAVDNRAKMVKGKRRGLTVATKDGPGRKTTVVVRGIMGMGRKRIVAGRRRVANAAFHAAHAFAQMLRDRGVKVGKVSFGKAPAESRKSLRQIGSHRSKPVFDLMSFCNKFSHNGYAETFFKLAGERVMGAPGTCAKGEAAVRKTFADSGIDWATVKLGNGSGLYHANRVTTTAVVRLLVAMSGKEPKSRQWRRTLAVGGVDGTLRRRMKLPATRGKIFAKTGTLDDVTALAGFAFGGGHRYAFALFYNGVRQPAYLYRRVHDRFLTYLLDPTGKLTPPPVVKKKPVRSKVKKRKKSKRRRARKRAKTRKKAHK
ncbi:MAG: D-alanyl-D-alanine carboxypeptidase/D-alanyl-D-alanine-endopeptidase [Myxococcales bacterium]|nr:D-alanyl-D-alanine carboxypeptidase/D-alanyl-D-alanine-endopeptidase [Myxococcales bacterium]